MQKFTENSKEAANLLSKFGKLSIREQNKTDRFETIFDDVAKIIDNDKNKGFNNEKRNFHATRKRATKSKLRTTGSSRLPRHGGH